MPQSWTSPFLDLRQRLDELFDELIYRRWAVPGPTAWQPALDFHETEDAYLVVVDLPGVAPDQTEVRVNDTEVIIAGDRPEPATEDFLLTRRERRCGRFRRSLTLPGPIDNEGARAECQHGTYRIWLPKKRQDERHGQEPMPQQARASRAVRITTR